MIMILPIPASPSSPFGPLRPGKPLTPGAPVKPCSPSSPLTPLLKAKINLIKRIKNEMNVEHKQFTTECWFSFYTNPTKVTVISHFT